MSRQRKHKKRSAVKKKLRRMKENAKKAKKVDHD